MPEAIHARDIQHYIPHRPPMVWIDEVTEYRADGGECLITLRGDGLYMSRRGLRAPSCLEFIAQAYGFCWIAYVTRIQDPGASPMARAFLAAFKDANFAAPERLSRVKAGDQLVVRISNRRPMGPIAAFKGEVLHQGEVIAAAQMRTFSE